MIKLGVFILPNKKLKNKILLKKKILKKGLVIKNTYLTLRTARCVLLILQINH